MRLIIAAAVGALLAVPAFADNNDSNHTGGTAKGAAVGALAGHEVGSGHAKAGALAGAAIGHHDKKKAEENSKD
ncbi:MAG TPA: hypothetical protein VFL55_08605 [Acetobacteraceae bacterium]|jgi:uncharacterized protein YcfJ|nr:hypothetical protein [Acetobacteraceae bacterium]